MRLTLTLLLTLFLSGTFFLRSTEALALSTCPTYPKPEVVIVPSIGAVTLDASHDYKQIESIAHKTPETEPEQPPENGIANNIVNDAENDEATAQTSPAQTGPKANNHQTRAKTKVTEKVVAGLYIPNERLSSTIDIVLTEIEFRSFCAAIKKVTLHFEAKPIIYLANEYPMNSCSYLDVLEHEKRHHALETEGQSRFLPYLHEATQKFLFNQGTIHASTPEKIKERLVQEINNFVTKIFTDSFDYIHSQQAEIDNAEEYHRLSVSCNGETQRFLHNYFNPAEAY